MAYMDRERIIAAFGSPPMRTAYRKGGPKQPDQRIRAPWRHLLEHGGFQGLALLPGSAGTPAKKAETALLCEAFADLDGRIPGFVLAAALQPQSPIADVDLDHDAIEQAVQSREKIRVLPTLYDERFAKPPRSCKDADLLLDDLDQLPWTFQTRIARESQAAAMLPNPWYFFKRATILDAIVDQVIQPYDILVRFSGARLNRIKAMALQYVQDVDPSNFDILSLAGNSKDRPN